jgi:hypothetical protein
MHPILPQKALFRHLFGLLADLINRTDIQERLFRQIVRFAAADFVEAFERVGDFYVDAFPI